MQLKNSTIRVTIELKRKIESNKILSLTLLSFVIKLPTQKFLAQKVLSRSLRLIFQEIVAFET